MNCPNCGFILPDDSKFCQYCGTVLSGNVPRSETAPMSSAPVAFSPDAVQETPAYTAPPTAQAAAPVPVSAAPIPAAPAYAAPFDTQAAAASPTAVSTPTAAPSPAAASATQNPGSAARQPHKIKKTKQCKACGADIDPRTRKCTACGRPASRVQPAALALAAVSVLLVFSLVINLLQYGSVAKVQQELEQQLESRDATITAQESAILELENQLEETEAKRQRAEAMLLYTETELKEAQEDTYNFDLIRSFLTKSDAGYASDQFYASKSVLILSMTGGDQTFSLTTGFSGGGEYSFSLSGNSARVSFTESSWHDHTTIRVSPRSTGVTYVTFSNTLNSQTFRVLVIVT